VIWITGVESAAAIRRLGGLFKFRLKKLLQLQECSNVHHILCGSCLHGRQNAPAYLAKANSISGARAPASDGELVAVFEPFSRFAIGQL